MVLTGLPGWVGWFSTMKCAKCLPQVFLSKCFLWLPTGEDLFLNSPSKTQFIYDFFFIINYTEIDFPLYAKGRKKEQTKRQIESLGFLAERLAIVLPFLMLLYTLP